MGETISGTGTHAGAGLYPPWNESDMPDMDGVLTNFAADGIEDFCDYLAKASGIGAPPLALDSIHEKPDSIEMLSSGSLVSAEMYVNRSDIEQQAHELIANRAEIKDQYKTTKTYRDDARTLLFEALTASGHLSKVEISGTLEEIHSTMLSVLLNSYSDNLPAHEKKRRFQEICEELIVQQNELLIVEGCLPEDTQTATVSDYITHGTMSSKAAKDIGYRASNKKGMIRSSRLIRESGGRYTRIMEQCSRSNAEASITRDFLKKQKITSPFSESLSGQADDVVVLGTQLMHQMKGGVVDLIMLLDQHQSKTAGKKVQYGESPKDEHLSYEELREKSLEREEAAECYIDDLATFTRQLDISFKNGKITQDEHEAELKHRVLTILRAICVVDTQYAADCFGEAAREGFERASECAASGDAAGAASIVEGNKDNETSVEVCGMSMSKEEADAKGLEYTSLEDKIKMGLEKLKTKMGFCRVDDCPSKPDRTEVGPCDVCMGNCQVKYDKGWTLTRIKNFYKKLRRIKSKMKNKLQSSAANLREKSSSTETRGLFSWFSD